MSTYILGFLFVLACIGLFVILDSMSRPLVRALLTGPLSNFYLNYLRSETETAFADNNPDSAWAGILFEKIYEMGISGVPYSKREKNLEYIKSAYQPRLRRKLANELIKVLPRQYGSANFQAKLACYICELLSKKSDEGELFAIPAQSTAIEKLTTAFSAWVAGGAFLLLSTYVYDQYPSLLVATSTLLLFIFMVMPLFKLVNTILTKLTSISLIATIIVLFLGGFSVTEHSASRVLEIGLDPYQNPNATLLIRYPEWLTLNNKDCNGKKISVMLRGQLSTPIKFRIDDNSFYFADKDCREIVPQLNETQGEFQAYEFYVVARDSSPFFSEKPYVEIIPTFLSSSRETDFDSNSVLRIKLERWIWNLFSNLYLSLGLVSTTTLLYLIRFILKKRAD